jgi:cellulose synthase/poly-beta-1,6-N-acetylglucosamine synthase-like glycosyltransferase
MKNGYPINKISVIMADAGFGERFHTIDFLNHQTLAKEKYELIWVEYYSGVKEELRKKEGVKIFTLNRTERPYHMAYCFNEGIKQSEGDLIVIMNADQVVGPTFLETIWREHEKCPDLAMYLQRWNEPREHHTGDISLQHLKKVCRYTNPRNYGGCLTVRKKWLLKVNGYEQHPIFAGLHALAMEMYTRLKNLGLHVKWHPHERIYHPWHPGLWSHRNRMFFNGR